MAALAVPVSFSTPAAMSAPVSLKLNYTCNFPLMDPQPLALEIRADIPKTLPVSTAAGEIPLQATATVSPLARKGLRALDAVTLQGTALAYAELQMPTGPSLDASVDTTITKTTIPDSGSLTTGATGEIPSLYSDEPGQITMKVLDTLVLRLDPRLADGGLSGLDRFESECTVVPGQNQVLAQVQVGEPVDQPPSKPGGLVGTPSENGIQLKWEASTDDIGVAGYDVFQGDVKVASVTGTTATVAGLQADTLYTFRVQARDTKGQPSPLSDPLSVRTTVGSQTSSYAYGVAGTAVIKTLTKGTIPVSGTSALNVAKSSNAVTGDITLANTTARLTAIGFLPVTAKLAFSNADALTGSLAGGVLSTTQKVRIKVPEVKLFGAIPLAGGNNCQTKQLTTLALKSGAGFDPTAGGTISGTFTISDLNGCGVLNGLVSPLTAGGGNTLTLKLTPKPIA